MKIGETVRSHIDTILGYCENNDPGELQRLQDRSYSKQQFDINFPFCKPAATISEAERVRYWRQTYVACGVVLRVTSQWVEPPTSQSRVRLERYLARLGLRTGAAIVAEGAPAEKREVTAAREPRAPSGRYRGNAIGNAQNLLVRNILSRLGDESFGEAHWNATKEAFGQLCAYCGAAGDLLMEHAVPINKASLGEHKLGNLVPSCRACNEKKADLDFRDYLADRPERLAAIEAHMRRHEYAPLGEDRQVRQIVDLAHKEVAIVAGRYTEILNLLLRERT